MRAGNSDTRLYQLGIPVDGSIGNRVRRVESTIWHRDRSGVFAVRGIGEDHRAFRKYDVPVGIAIGLQESINVDRVRARINVTWLLTSGHSSGGIDATRRHVLNADAGLLRKQLLDRREGGRQASRVIDDELRRTGCTGLRLRSRRGEESDSCNKRKNRGSSDCHLFNSAGSLKPTRERLLVQRSTCTVMAM